ncbi:MAG: response regulator [Desulfobacterales bacterium]|nr:response regulator [Desulfobacterales bacterium]
MNPIKILLIEDNPLDALVIHDMLFEYRDIPIQIVHKDYLAKAIEHLNTHNPDIVLLDLSLPDSDGINTLLTVIEQAKPIPIVVLTGSNDELLAIEAVRKGAQDYMVKGKIYEDMLIRTIHYAIERYKIHAELKQMVYNLSVHEKQFRTIIEKNIDGMLIVTLNGIIRYVNPAATQILDSNVEELVNQHFKWFIGVRSNQENTWLKKNGRLLTTEMKCVEMEWEGEESLLILIRDITYRKEMEKVLEEKQKLQGVIEMAGAICHELNQPLQALFGELELFTINCSEQDPNKSRLDKLKIQAERIGNITKHLNRITYYKTKTYIEGTTIVDIEQSSKS